MEIPMLDYFKKKKQKTRETYIEFGALVFFHLLFFRRFILKLSLANTNGNILINFVSDRLKMSFYNWETAGCYCDNDMSNEDLLHWNMLLPLIIGQIPRIKTPFIRIWKPELNTCLPYVPVLTEQWMLLCICPQKQTKTWLQGTSLNYK